MCCIVITSGQLCLCGWFCYVSMSLWILLAKRKEECFPVGIFVLLVCGMLVVWGRLCFNPLPMFFLT